ncbi:hypothetical protein CH63R_12625 [Colletotrichum higginsianum IMI 349063]|uniref:Protein kinase domain-containing protein n=2 Tax=Colletotrichum higginsianum TaxID=80884 RepID=A0A1B7XUS8_COLHI|nr:hypothetical protein CH63R_12625 [Colletotrichum higginsianum IMI 349063]OBR03498.1 hypothetical protein CH63R_12625 [Colletotrichum higginsianum IMI 349063]
MSSSARFDIAQYGSGKQLDLKKYSPANPHGLSRYPAMPPPPLYHLRGFNPGSETQVKLEILESLSGGVDGRAQVLLCKVIKPPPASSTVNVGEGDHEPVPGPGTRIVAKVYDSRFWPSDYGAPISNHKLADGDLCCESYAYKYLYQKKLTGYPHLTAQYYGTWAVTLPRGKNKSMSVGLILMEHIVGYSIDELCDRDKYEQLVPDVSAPIIFHESNQAKDGEVCLELTKENRMEVLKQFIDGCVRHMHVGIAHNDAEPHNVFVTMRNGNDDLDKPRTVMLDHILTEVWSMTADARKPGCETHCLEMSSKPPHPMERYSVKALPNFAGWYPGHWVKPGNHKLFDQWLIEAFGPLEDSDDSPYCTFAVVRECIKEKKAANARMVENIKKAEDDKRGG